MATPTHRHSQECLGIGAKVVTVFCPRGSCKMQVLRESRGTREKSAFRATERSIQNRQILRGKEYENPVKRCAPTVVRLQSFTITLALLHIQFRNADSLIRHWMIAADASIP